MSAEFFLLSGVHPRYLSFLDSWKFPLPIAALPVDDVFFFLLFSFCFCLVMILFVYFLLLFLLL